MAVTSVQQLFQWSGGIDRRGKRTYNVLYQVWVSAITDGPATVLNSAMTAKIGSVYPGDTAAICVDVVPNRVERLPYLWHLSVTYETPVFNEAEHPGWSIRGHFQKRREAVIEDLDGNRIENTAHDLFDPPYEMEVGDQAIIFECERDDNPATTHYECWNHVNENAIFGYDAGEVLCYDARWSLTSDNGTDARYKETIAFQCRDGGFHLEPANIGFNKLADAAGGLVSGGTSAANIRSYRITDPQGNMATQPQLLDAHGNVLPNTDPAVYLDFRILDSYDFDTLSIPNIQLKPEPPPDP